MSQAPSMPLYTDALLGDTLHLSAEEFGAYCLLLFATWRNNGQPLRDNDRELAHVCRVSLWRWRRVFRKKLVHFFDISDGTWRQKRLEKEWNFVQKLRESQSFKGRASAKARALKKKETASTGVSTEAQPNVNPHTHTLKNLSQPALIETHYPARAREADDAAGWLAGSKICEEWLSEAAEARERAGKPPVDLAGEAAKCCERWRLDPPRNPRRAWLGYAMAARLDGHIPTGEAGGYRRTDVPDGPPPRPEDVWPDLKAARH